MIDQVEIIRVDGSRVERAAYVAVLRRGSEHGFREFSAHLFNASARVNGRAGIAWQLSVAIFEFLTATENFFPRDWITHAGTP